MAEQPALARPEPVVFDHHDQSLGESVHDVYRDLRTRSPMEWTESYGGFWVATGYEVIEQIARNRTAFSSRSAFIPDTMGGALLVPQMVDGPEHTKFRTLLRDWFTPRRIAGFEPVVRSVTQGLVAALESPADVSAQLAAPMPLNIILKVIGVKDDQLDEVSRGVRYVTEHGDDTAGASGAFQAAIAFIREGIMAPLRDAPGDDLISYLLTQKIDGVPLDDELIATIAFSIIGAGFDTTYRTLSSSMAYLGEHPDAQAAARTAPVESVVEELLRLFAPVSAARLVLEDTEVAGRHLQAGDKVLLVWPSANRDEAKFADPDEPDFHRSNNRHRTFGAGAHSCLGMHLARLELRVALEEIFRSFSTFGIQPGARPTYQHGQVWGATSVPIEFQRNEAA